MRFSPRIVPRVALGGARASFPPSRRHARRPPRRDGAPARRPRALPARAATVPRPPPAFASRRPEGGGRHPAAASASPPRASRASAARASSSADDDAPPPPPARVAVFVSGGGSNLRALHAAMLDGRVRAEVCCVVTNLPDCGGASWARDRLGVPVLTYPAKKSDPSSGLTAAELVRALEVEHAAEYVCLAGYLRLIPPELCRAFERKMLNIHPALLPAFGGKGMHGMNVHEAVVRSGARVSGPTVHFVNEKFDEGKILAQAVVRVDPGVDAAEDVAAKVLEKEHEIFADALGALVDGRVEFREEDGVPIVREGRG